MPPATPTKLSAIKETLGLSSDKSIWSPLCKTLLVSGLILYLASIFLLNDQPSCQASEFFSAPLRYTWNSFPKPNPTTADHSPDHPTDLGHLVFGLVGSEKAWRFRKSYIESWWRPNVTRGYLYLDRAPAEDLLPWPPSSPPFRVSDDNTKLLQESKHVAPIMVRMVHAILELFREEHEGIDLVGDISGFLSAHPQSPLMSLHHFDFIEPIFPSKNRFESADHLMKAANIDQSRLLQQTICYQKQSNWSFSIAWGYSAYIFEKVLPRSILKTPLETFRPWVRSARPPHFLFDTRWPSNDPCEAPHVFFFESIEKTIGNEIVTSYVRASPRNLPACSFTGNHSADHISKIQVFTSAMKPIENGRSECCDVVPVDGLNITEDYSSTCSPYSCPKTPNCQPSEFLLPLLHRWAPSQALDHSPTNISHLVFGISGSVKTWRYRKPYIESWWQQNITRGYIFLDSDPTKELLPWPSSSPPFRVSEDTSKFNMYSKHTAPHVIRIVRIILETFREENKGVRWYVMGDDDTIFSIDNLVEVLAKYDHTKYLYVGGLSECVKSNFDHSVQVAFGGAGVALSYPLAAALVTNLDECINRYPYYRVSDLILKSCIADFGVSLTPEKGFHQIDLHNDISGLLSAHPETPLVSLHHLDTVDPIFPSKNRHESVNHLMKAMKSDHSRLSQQAICYHKQSNWSFSIAWGYSTHIYEQIYPRSILKRPLETFRPWLRSARLPLYMFDTRLLSDNPCEAPHVFFFESIENTTENHIVTSYVRASPRGLPACSSSGNGNQSADHISKIRVFSSATTKLGEVSLKQFFFSQMRI
ncbi:hypothetical protein F0562_001203 [Nyssa sinensis]|uniref:Uncharacterized protein n=1 Tax=Nyssa sinensis TaxID=561372 RepID=A0A5J5C3R2_9ASTE|nr:hypothetical protein F0562_001203 [Nyssa sinensis]